MMHSASRLARALTDTFAVQQTRATALLTLLDEESRALESGDIAAMDRTAAGKTAALSELEQLKATEAGVLAGLPFAGSEAPLEQALQWCDETGAVRELHDEVRRLMIECDRRNHRNGLLVQHRLNYVRRAVELLQVAHAEAMTYGPDGMVRDGGGSRLLAEG